LRLIVKTNRYKHRIKNIFEFKNSCLDGVKPKGQLFIDEAKAELNGVTLESLVAERVARAVKLNIQKGILKKEDFPLLLHIDEIICNKKEVRIPWEEFNFVKEV